MASCNIRCMRSVSLLEYCSWVRAWNAVICSVISRSRFCSVPVCTGLQGLLPCFPSIKQTIRDGFLCTLVVSYGIGEGLFRFLEDCFWVFYCFKIIQKILGSIRDKCHAFILNGKCLSNFFRVIFFVFLWLNAKFTKIQKSFYSISSFVSIIPDSIYMPNFMLFCWMGNIQWIFSGSLFSIFTWLNIKWKNTKFLWLHIQLCFFHPWQYMYQISCFHIEWKISNEFFVLFLGVFFMIKHKIHKITKNAWLDIQFCFYDN